MVTEPILASRNLTKEFGALIAVNDVSISIVPGTLHSVIGPNGAGKTTLFNLLSGTLKPTSGRVFHNGADITADPVYRMIHMGIGRSFQITNIFPLLTVLENVRLAAQAVGSDDMKFWKPTSAFPGSIDRAQAVLEDVGLDGDAAKLAKALPHGDQRKLELAMILAPDPEVLLLDEPTAGMASEQVPELMELITRIQSSGDKTVVLVEHNMNVVMSISDQITVMHQGAVLAEGTPSEIGDNPTVQEAYLGSLYEKGSGG
jgi:branched-chain amino acid transport system ATP-binding protein